MGCKIKTIQTDNGREFCNDADMSKSLFQIALKKLGINHKGQDRTPRGRME